KFDCDRSFDARAFAAIRSDLGGAFQLHRLCDFWDAGGENDWRRPGAHRSNSSRRALVCALRGIDGRHRLEPHYLVLGFADLEFARPDWWLWRRGNSGISWRSRIIEAGRLDQDAGVHRRFSGDRLYRWLPLNAGGLLDFPSVDARAGGQDISTRAIAFCGSLLAGPWRQRRAEDDGYHHGSPGDGWIVQSSAWSKRRAAGDSTLRGLDCSCRNCFRNIGRWLANRAHHGIEDHQAATRRRLLRRDCRLDHSVWRDISGYSRLHDAHHHRSNCGRWISDSIVRGEVASRRPNCVGMDSHHPRRSYFCRNFLLRDRTNSHARNTSHLEFITTAAAFHYAETCLNYRGRRGHRRERSLQP